jgi:predicted alpha/beta hydrolase
MFQFVAGVVAMWRHHFGSFALRRWRNHARSVTDSYDVAEQRASKHKGRFSGASRIVTTGRCREGGHIAPVLCDPRVTRIAYAASVNVATELLDRGTDRLAVHHYPDPGPAAPVVTIWPAMGVPARFYRPFAEDLHRNGFAVSVADLRGTGASTPKASRASRYRLGDLVADVAAVDAAMERRLAGRRRMLLGHSLGGQACVLHLALSQAGGRPAPVAGLVLVATGLPWWRSYGGPWQRFGVLGFTQWVATTSALLRVWPGWGFGGRQARGVISDWAFTARRGRFRPVGGVDAEAALAALTTPVLAISVEPDQYTPASTVDHLVGKLRAAPVVRALVTPAEAAAPLDHFQWVRASAPITARVKTFFHQL